MIKHFFNYEIVDWESWSRVFRSPKQFYYLVKEIFRIERLAFDEIENCKPGTNGVFKVGNFIVKIFVPKESGYNSAPDYTSELYALKMANQLGVSIPNLLAYGEIRDKYLFRYLIMDYIEGKTLGDIRECLTKKQKQLIGAKLRKIVDKWATECDNFNDIEALKRTLVSKRWAGASRNLLEHQEKIIRKLQKEKIVFVHGDLTEDNIIIKGEEIYILDFADSVCAPAIYEEMTVICDAFAFDLEFLKGYYSKLDITCIVDRCIDALLCHEYGFLVINNIFGKVDSIETLRSLIRRRLTSSCKEAGICK